MTPELGEIVPPFHRQGNGIPSAAAAIRWPDFSVFPCPEAYSASFLVIQTHLIRCFYLAADFLGLRRSGFSSQVINPAQDLPE